MVDDRIVDHSVLIADWQWKPIVEHEGFILVHGNNSKGLTYAIFHNHNGDYKIRCRDGHTRPGSYTRPISCECDIPLKIKRLYEVLGL